MVKSKRPILKLQSDKIIGGRSTNRWRLGVHTLIGGQPSGWAADTGLLGHLILEPRWKEQGVPISLGHPAVGDPDPDNGQFIEITSIEYRNNFYADGEGRVCWSSMRGRNRNEMKGSPEAKRRHLREQSCETCPMLGNGCTSHTIFEARLPEHQNVPTRIQIPTNVALQSSDALESFFEDIENSDSSSCRAFIFCAQTPDQRVSLGLIKVDDGEFPEKFDEQESEVSRWYAGESDAYLLYEDLAFIFAQMGRFDEKVNMDYVPTVSIDDSTVHELKAVSEYYPHYPFILDEPNNRVLWRVKPSDD